MRDNFQLNERCLNEQWLDRYFALLKRMTTRDAVDGIEL